MDYAALARESLARVAASKPLIHQITNVVVTNDSANITLASARSPVMAYAPQEVAEMAALAGGAGAQIGTLSRGEIAHAAGRSRRRRARRADRPRPGRRRARRRSAPRAPCACWRELPITVLRGNRGEIGALVGSGEMRGVDASGSKTRAPVAEAARGALRVDRRGDRAVDIVVGGGHDYRRPQRLTAAGADTGSGCMATAAIGIFLAAGRSRTAGRARLWHLRPRRRARCRGDPGPGTFRCPPARRGRRAHAAGTERGQDRSSP